MQTLLPIILFFLCFAGFSFIFGFNPFARRRIIALSKDIVRDRQKKLIGRDKLNVKERLTAKVDAVIEMCGSSKKVFAFLSVCVAAIGVIGGAILFNEPLLALVCCFCVLPIPYIIFTVKSRWYKRNQDELLENTMNLITNSYLGCDDILKAVRDNLGKLDISAPFAEFVAEVTLIDSSIKKGLRKLEVKIKNQHFSEWTDLLLLSQDNREMKFMLPAVVEGMNDAKRLQLEADTVMMAVWREYFISILLAFSVVPLIKFSNAEWFALLTGTLIGKVLLVLLLLAIAVSALAVMKINKPL